VAEAFYQDIFLCPFILMFVLYLRPFHAPPSYDRDVSQADNTRNGFQSYVTVGKLAM
jgi:hypothetical protein